MSASVRHITVDCRDPYQLGVFWSSVIGAPLASDDEPGDPEALIDLGPDRPGLLFVQVPEGKSVKNRLHLDLQPDQPRDVEVARILELGATQVADHRRPDGTSWVTLADHEGNEFCVEMSAEERAASS